MKRSTSSETPLFQAARPAVLRAPLDAPLLGAEGVLVWDTQLVEVPCADRVVLACVTCQTTARTTDEDPFARRAAFARGHIHPVPRPARLEVVQPGLLELVDFPLALAPRVRQRRALFVCRACAVSDAYSGYARSDLRADVRRKHACCLPPQDSP